MKFLAKVYRKSNFALSTLLTTYSDGVWTESFATRTQLLVFIRVFWWTHFTAGPPRLASGAAAGGSCYRVSKRITADAMVSPHTDNIQETLSFTAVC